MVHVIVIVCQMNSGKAMVSDFGMARLKQSEEDSSKTETKVGPLKWMAPGTFHHVACIIYICSCLDVDITVDAVSH